MKSGSPHIKSIQNEENDLSFWSPLIFQFLCLLLIIDESVCTALIFINFEKESLLENGHCFGRPKHRRMHSCCIAFTAVGSTSWSPGGTTWDVKTSQFYFYEDGKWSLFGHRDVCTLIHDMLPIYEEIFCALRDHPSSNTIETKCFIAKARKAVGIWLFHSQAR